MRRYFMVFLMLFVPAAVQAGEDDFLKLCEAKLLLGLKAPSSYRRISAAVEFKPDVAEGNAKYVLPNLDCEGNPTAYNPDRDCSGHLNAVTERSGTWEALVSFDAQNLYGALLRRGALCEIRSSSKEVLPLNRDKMQITFVE